MPMAHVVECRSDRQVLLDERFMPTVLRVKACPPLDTFLTELLGMLRQRSMRSRSSWVAADAAGLPRSATS